MPSKKRRIQDPSLVSDSPSSPSSPVSVNSVCDSSDFQVSLLHYFEMSDKKNWEEWEENIFVETYIDWQSNGRWDPTRSTLANYTALATYLTQERGIRCTATQCQSKFYRFQEKWRLFTHLRGDSAQPETGIGWDAEQKCFLAGAEQWAYLYQMNKHYIDFQHPNSADLYMKLDAVLGGKTATGCRAQSSTQPPPQWVPPRVRRRRRDVAAAAGCGPSSSVINPSNHFSVSDDDGLPIPRNPGKRTMSSNGASSEREGSKGSKCSRSGSDNYQEALSNFNRFSFIASSEKEAKAKYSMGAAKQVVESLNLEERLHMFLLKELLDEEFRALFLSFSEKEQRVWIEMFIIPKIAGQ